MDGRASLIINGACESPILSLVVSMQHHPNASQLWKHLDNPIHIIVMEFLGATALGGFESADKRNRYQSSRWMR
jgi:hypothetical protein